MAVAYDAFGIDDMEGATHDLPPLLLNEDLRQEQALAQLQGKHGPSARWNRPAKEVGYGLSCPANATAFWGNSEAPSEAVIDKLVAWTTQQSATVQLAVQEYLEDPRDEALNQILLLINQAVPEKEADSKPNFAQLVIRALPATKDQLIQMAFREHLAKRPEATVRQVLRRLSRAGQIVEVNGRYERATTTSSRSN